MNDQEIIQLYFDRDERAIEETDRRYGRLCMQVSMNILNSRPDAEECVNDTWLKTWNSIPPQRPGILRAFLCRITRNLSLDRYRALHREKRNRDLEVALEELEDCIPLAEEEAGLLPELINAFLATLTDTDADLFMGRYWHGYPVKRLAQAYGMSANAVSLRLYKTRERLRAFLEERGYRV